MTPFLARSLISLGRRSAAPAAVVAAFASISAAYANDCHTRAPRITGVTERNGANCGRTNSCGFIIVHWSGGLDCHHFNIRERSGHQFEAPGTNRNQLANRRSAAFPNVRFGSNNKIFLMVQACTKPLIGSSHCTGWSPEFAHDVEPMAGKVDPRKQAACRNYATRAVTHAKFVRDNHCDPKVYSGPRWTTNFDEHLRWCLTAAPATANFENRERTRMAEECRKGPPAGPKGGTPKIAVTDRAGDTFFITGSGFPPNAPVIIRLSGPGASIATVTVVNGQRLTADKNGNFSIRLFGAQVCKRGGGAITFTAEDQDRPQKASGTSKCAP